MDVGVGVGWVDGSGNFKVEIKESVSVRGEKGNNNLHKLSFTLAS